MKATKKSEHDNKVTITTKRLATQFPWISVGKLQDGSTYDLTFRKGNTYYTTKFNVSRNGKTFYGPLPAGFKMPTVGKGVNVNVVNVERGW